MADVADAHGGEVALEYERDVYGWAMQQARLLREGRLSELDVENVAEEIESVGRSERRELVNRLATLLQHLLKWEHQPERRGRSWLGTISEQRERSIQVLRDNPSLRPMLPGILNDAFRIATRTAMRETNLPRDSFPATCPYAWEQVMNEAFLPD